MHIVALGWVFVVVLMALAEATSAHGSLLGALVTLGLYGVLPLSIVLYVMGTPMRRRARKRAESSPDGDGSSHAAAAVDAGPLADAADVAAVTAERKEP
jgi:membrane protein implicated in regulation of membrane protease activity